MLESKHPDDRQQDEIGVCNFWKPMAKNLALNRP